MATRSPSPNPSRPKTPDFNNNLRKSKEFPPKSSAPNSLSLRSSFEQKENLKLRSPSISSAASSKGSKNFMAPTISAASKVIAASPRKKILQERNEVISSVTGSFEFPNKEESTGIVIDDVGSKSEVGFCSREVSNSVELKKEDLRIKNPQKVSSSSQISPLDADPSLPPYDPRTNYLSPRPQFLHYKPNPRIEQYLNREGEFTDVGDGRKLEDSFSSESSEDDVTTLTDEQDSKGEDSFHSEVEELESENGTRFVPEPKPEPEFKTKPFTRRPFKKSKLIPFLLVLVLACIYAPLSDSPIISSSTLKDHIQTPSLDDLHLRDYLAVAYVNLNGLVGRIKHWSTDSIAYFTSLNFPPDDDAGLCHFFNSTPTIDESRDLDLSCNHETVTEQSIGETESEMSEIMKEGNVEIDGAGNEAGKIKMEVSEDIMDANIAGYEMEEEINEEEGRNESEQEIEVKNAEIGPEIIGDEENYKDAILIAELEQGLIHLSREAPGVEEEVEDADIVLKSEDAEENIIDTSSFDDPSEFGKEYQNVPGLELLKSMNHGTVLGLSLASLVLVSILVFLYKKPAQTPKLKKEMTSKKVGSVSGRGKTYTTGKGVTGDLASTEVSTSFNNTSRKRQDDEEQNLTHERRLRRDSTASSSISYGSFTTYERRSTKKGSKEEEVVTPVRRSSRIWNQSTSP